MQIPYIRPYNNEDLAAVVEINRHLRVLPFTENWAISHYMSALPQGRGGCFVAEAADQGVVAFGILNQLQARPHDFTLYLGVNPASQHAGVGRLLIETLKDVAVHRGAQGLIAVLQNEDLDVVTFLATNGFKLRNYTWHLTLPGELLAAIGRSALPKGVKLASFEPQQQAEFKQLYQQALQNSPRFERYSDLDLESLAQEETYQPGDILVARSQEDGQGLGLAVLQLEASSRSHLIATIEPLGVIPEWRGTNLETALLKAALVRGQERGAASSEIWVHSADSLTLEVYTKVGFERVGMRLTYTCKLANPN